MKKILLVLLAIVVLFGLLAFSKYNGVVTSEEAVKTAWADVETQYQRRADLIPQIVNTVKGQANYERETLNQVMNARASATQVKIDPNNLDEASFSKFQQAQDQLSSALSRLLVTVERYPELKANEGFMNLQTQLEGTENRISQARRVFNEKVKEFNTKIRQFPTNLVATIFGFKQKAYFQSVAGSEKAPEVNFGSFK